MGKEWPSRQRWDELQKGIGCPLCEEFPEVDDSGFTVAHLSKSILRLARNQFSAGYSVLVCTEHGPEPYSLQPKDQAAYLDDMARVGAALDRVFAPDKMNFLTLGNSVPHLHTHLIPRYLGDPEPGAPYLPESGTVTLTEAGYQDRVDRIRRALG